MIYFYAIIFGAIQGFTEFFPVSSSGHLLIAHKLFPVFSNGLDLTFDVALHLATLAILLIVYGRDFWQYVIAFFPNGDAVHRRTGLFVVLGTIPAALVGYFFEHIIEERTRVISIVAVMLLVGAVLFFIVERWGSRCYALGELRWWQVVLMGCAQVFALIPGMSRSGSIIIAGMALGLKRDAATQFSFLLAIPIIGLAGAERLMKLFATSALQRSDAAVFLLGFLTAAGIGFLCIRYLLEHVKTKTFIPFAWYRIVLGILLLAVLFFT